MAQGDVVEASESLNTHPIDIADGELPFRFGGLPTSYEGVGDQHRAVIRSPLQIPADPIKCQPGYIFMA